MRMSRGSQWDGGNENTAYPGHVGVKKLKKEGARTPKKRERHVVRRAGDDQRTWTLIESVQSAGD